MGCNLPSCLDRRCGAGQVAEVGSSFYAGQMRALATVSLVMLLVSPATAAPLSPVSITASPNGVVELTGKLDGGTPIDLAWASKSQVACFPSIRNMHFQGNHVLYVVELPARSEMRITATPADPSLDLSLYAYSVAPGDTKSIPPNVLMATCEASFGSNRIDAPMNPGKPESVELRAIANPYRVYIGVAGAKGVTRGAFKLRVELATAAPQKTGRITRASRIVAKPNATVEVQGKIDGGVEIPLGWAADSQVACFPTPHNVHFEGKHVLFATELPPRSEMTIELVPARADLDLNLYAYSVAPGDTKSMPPAVLHATCESSYGSRRIDQPMNPGQPEKVQLRAIQHPYRVYIGVAGPKGVTAGDFKLVVHLATAAPPKTGKITHATPLVSKANETVELAGKIDGGVEIPLDWAAGSQVACFPTPQNVHFEGKHVLYTTELPAKSEMTITVVPTRPDLDLSLYAYSVATGDTRSLPPEVLHATCEASYGSNRMDQRMNPGQPEKVQLRAIQHPYRVYIGVAGAKGVTAGDFKLVVHLKSDTRIAKGTRITSATPIVTRAGAMVEAQGSLDGGTELDLDWAANPQVSCFPTTQNVHFEGNHVMFMTELPEQSILSISAIPKDPTLDLSLYAYSVAKGDTTSLPPNVLLATCRSSYGTNRIDQPMSPGKTESVELNAITHPYRVYIGVAGAKGVKRGAFTLQVQLKGR